jgi:hypothetical protein
MQYILADFWVQEKEGNSGNAVTRELLECVLSLSQRCNHPVPDLDKPGAFDPQTPAWNLSCWCAWGHATKVKAARSGPGIVQLSSAC